MKKLNALEKFQKFWGDLSDLEKSDLWLILIALRGPDDGGYTLKTLTTARIRGVVFPELETLDWNRIIIREQLTDTQITKAKKILKKRGHFYRHILIAFETLLKLADRDVDDIEKIIK